MNFYGSLLCKILEILQFFQYTKIYETIENVGIASFYRIYLLAAIITMRLLVLKILFEDEILISSFHFLCKVLVSVYYSVYLSFLLSKKIFSYRLSFIKFLILCTLRLIILFLRFLFCLTILYLLFVFLASNMTRAGSVFDVNVRYIVNDDFNEFRSFLIFSNNSIHVDVLVNVSNCLNCKFYDHNFQSKPESKSNNFKLEISTGTQ